MTGVTVDAGAFLADFKRALGELDRRARQDVQERANRIRGRARQLVHVSSGQTRDSIEVIVHEDGSADVRVGARQGLFEEFGTHDMAPRPFLRPAVAEEK